MKKLTKDVFNYPECPKWAKYAAVDSDGITYWYEFCPIIFEEDGVWVKTGDSEAVYIPGEFDASDWTNSLIERRPEMKKLTREVFSYPECPKWAKYAAVDSNGCAYYYANRVSPSINEDGRTGRWTFPGFDFKQIPGEFDASDWTNSLVKRDNNKEKEKIMYRDSKGRFAKKDTQTPDFFDELVENVKDIVKVRNAEKNELPALRILGGIRQINEALQELPPEKVNRVIGLIATYFRRALSSRTTLDKLGEVLYELSTPESH